MSGFDVDPGEMDELLIDDEAVEALIAGRADAGVPERLRGFVEALRSDFSASPEVPVRGPLAELVELVDLTSAPSGEEVIDVRRGTRMIPAISSFLATLAGKVVLGAAVAAAAVGGAQAADVVDIPGLSGSDPAEESVVAEEETLEEEQPTEGEEGTGGDDGDEVDEGTDGEEPEDGDEGTDEEATDEEATDEEATDEEATDDGEDGSGELANHGQVVSEFARTTELEGCAKGQAIAELASGGRRPEHAGPPAGKCEAPEVGEEQPESELPGDDGTGSTEDKSRAAGTSTFAEQERQGNGGPPAHASAGGNGRGNGGQGNGRGAGGSRGRN